MIEIVEEISAVIKIESLQETANIARELRESIAATEPVVEIETGNVFHEINSEQLHLSHKLQKAISALLVQVYDCSQELAPGIGEVLQRIAKVTAHLQADLVAVTGVNVAVQAPDNFVVEEQLFDTLHKPAQIQRVLSIPTDGIAESSETVVFENVDNIAASIDYANAEQLVKENIAAESLISQVQETTEVLNQVSSSELDSLRVTHEIDVENSMLPVSNEEKVIATEIAIKAGDTLIASSTEEVLKKSESDKVWTGESGSGTEQFSVKAEIEKSINLNGKFVFLCFSQRALTKNISYIIYLVYLYSKNLFN